MLRRISTKFVLAVLAAVVLPFLGFAAFVDTQLADRLTRHVVQQTLLGLAANLGDAIDDELARCNQDLQFWTTVPWASWALEEYAEESASLERVGGERDWGAEQTIALERDAFTGGGAEDFRRQQTRNFDRFLFNRRYELLLLVGADGRLVACNGRDADGEPLDAELVRSLFARDYGAATWFRGAMAGEQVGQGHHVSPYLPRRFQRPEELPRNYHVGFAGPVHHYLEPERVSGVIYGLVNWSRFQDMIATPVVKELFRGFVGAEEFPSAYAWIWDADANTILAHKDPTLYYHTVDGPGIELPELVEAARAGTWGLYPEYTFKGVRKNAAFKHTQGPEQGGFGWVVGVGIDNDDIYAPLREMRRVLYAGTAVVLLVIVLWTMVIARRTTEPIVALQEHTARVAAGDLDARIEIRSRDELGELADAFNRMTAELSETTEKLIRAEKDAAWREMARQIAHDIKNPLTPIRLSLDLLARARAEGSPNLEQIQARTLELVNRQVDNLREIATDFYEFTGGRRPRPERLDALRLVDEVLELHAAWAEELGVRMRRPKPGWDTAAFPATVWADPGKLRRVIVNLVSNALEAMPEGGDLEVVLAPVEASGPHGAGRLRMEFRDTGSGLSEEVRAHLFDPYFTTRSEGTGLGLAIARRVLEEMDGTIAVEPRADGPGTVARIELPCLAPDGEPDREPDRGPAA